MAVMFRVTTLITTVSHVSVISCGRCAWVANLIIFSWVWGAEAMPVRCKRSVVRRLRLSAYIMVASLEGEGVIISGIGSEIKVYTHASYMGAGDEARLYR